MCQTGMLLKYYSTAEIDSCGTGCFVFLRLHVRWYLFICDELPVNTISTPECKLVVLLGFGGALSCCCYLKKGKSGKGRVRDVSWQRRELLPVPARVFFFGGVMVVSSVRWLYI